MQFLLSDCGDKTEKILKECEEAENELKNNMITYQQLMK